MLGSSTMINPDFYPRSPCGERHWPRVMVSPTLYFYPRSPCGERRYWFGIPVVGRSISIHALLAESDVTIMDNVIFVPRFLSTLSLRRATGPQGCYTLGGVISIHALLAESDRLILFPGIMLHGFYPRSPCGERPFCIWALVGGLSYISIHALLAESDIKNSPALLSNDQFLSTLSLRRATAELTTLVSKLFISIHALLAESDYQYLS